MASRLMLAEGEVQRSKEGVIHLMATRIIDRTAMLDTLGNERRFAPEVCRSDERRVGTECVSTCTSRWSPSHQTKSLSQLLPSPSTLFPTYSLLPSLYLFLHLLFLSFSSPLLFFLFLL